MEMIIQAEAIETAAMDPGDLLLTERLVLVPGSARGQPSPSPAPGLSPSPLGWSSWWQWLSSSYLPARGADRDRATA